MPSATPRLLVSVRDAAEAGDACTGGAEVIDVKEPSRGPLGRADDAGTAAVVEVVQSLPTRRIISAALGELRELDASRLSLLPGVDFAKVGLAGADGDWSTRLCDIINAFGDTQPIVAAYADAARVGAPLVAHVIDWACERGVGVLIDTAVKDGRGLFDWLNLETIAGFVRQLHEVNSVIALAGSLHGEAIDRAASLEPDFVAVRGAACAGGDRTGCIDTAKVAGLARRLRATHVRTV